MAEAYCPVVKLSFVASEREGSIVHMIIYLASGNGGTSTGVGGLWLSSATALIGALAYASSRIRFWAKRSHDLAIIEKAARAVDGPETDRVSIAAGDVDQPQAELEGVIGRKAPSLETHFDEILRNRVNAQFDETKSLFRRAKVSFWSFLGVSLGTSAVLLYGAYAAIFGHTEVGIVVALSSAIPGTFSVGLYRIQKSIDQRADKALHNLDREVERKVITKSMLEYSNEIHSEDSRESIKILAALRSVIPDATPGELASLLDAIKKPSKE